MRAWNLLGGLDWSGVEKVADLLGYDDMEILIMQLQIIRDFQQRAR